MKQTCLTSTIFVIYRCVRIRNILVKLVKLGIGQKVLGIWNWAFDKNYKPYSARTAPRRGRGRRIARRAYRQATTAKNIRVFASDGGGLLEHSSDISCHVRI